MKKIYQNYKKTCITFCVLAALVIFYTLFGFFGVPWLITSVAPWALKDKNATLIVQEAKFNPYKFELNVTGASLKTYVDVLKFEELDVGLNFKELFSKNINIKIVRLKEPYVNIQREQNLSFNFDSLVVSDEPEKTQDEKDEGESFFNVTLDKFRLIKGDFRFADESLSRPFQVTLHDLSYEIDGIDLKNHSIGRHVLGTGSNLMDEFDWKGGVSLKPLKIYGDVKFSGLKMDKIWQSYMSGLDFNVTRGLLDSSLKYVVSVDESGVHADLKDTKLGAREFVITDKNSTIKFNEISLDGINLGGNFSGKNELNLGLNEISLKDFRRDDTALKSGRISGVKLALLSDEKLKINGEIEGVNLGGIEQNSTALTKLESLALKGLKYEMSDKFSANLSSLNADKFSLNGGQTALNLTRLDLNGTRVIFDTNLSLLDMAIPALNLGDFSFTQGENSASLGGFEANEMGAKFDLNASALEFVLPVLNLSDFSFTGGKNSANFSGFNVQDTSAKFDLNNTELDALIPSLNLRKFSFKNADISVQNELFYVKDVRALARQNFADINASSANFGLNGVKFSGFDFDAASKNFDFKGLNASAKSEANATKIGLNLAGLKSADIDINALKQKFIKLAGLGASELKFDGENLALKQIKLNKTDVFSSGKSFAGFGGITLNNMAFDTVKSALAIKDVKINSPFFNDEISQKGAKAVNNLAILKAPAKKSPPKKTAKAKQAAKTAKKERAKTEQSAGGFALNIENIELTGAKSNITQSFLGEPMKHEIALKTAKITNFSSDFTKPFGVNLKVQTGENLSLETKGKIALSPLKAELNAKFDASDLARLNHIVSRYANAQISSGKISLGAKLNLDKSLKTKANFELTGFGLNDLVGTKVIGVNAVNIADIALDEKSAALKNLTINEPFIKARIFSDKSINLAKLAKDDNNVSDANASAGKKAATEGKKSEFDIDISGVEIKNASVDFSDDSLILPFVFEIRKLNANIDKIAQGVTTKLNSQGVIGSGGSANVEVQIDAFDPKKFSDISLKFKDVELNEVTPYSATFVGRKIDSGLLDLSLVYALKDRKLDGKNDVRIDTIKLGESVESPNAMNLPLQLAISILQDSNNVISLNLPVSGDLDNPEFSYGGIIGKAILQIFTDVVTSPFRLIGSVLGIGSAEELAAVDFTAGKGELLDSQAKKVQNFKSISDNKKDVVFVINPAFDEAADTLALQKRALDRETALVSRQRGISEFEALKSIAAAKLKNPPSDPYNELVKLQKIKPQQLEELARQRAQNLKEAMLAAGVPGDQMRVADKIQKVEAKMQLYVGIPMGIENKK